MPIERKNDKNPEKENEFMVSLAEVMHAYYLIFFLSERAKHVLRFCVSQFQYSNLMKSIISTCCTSKKKMGRKEKGYL